MYSLKEGMQINLSLIPLQGGRALSFAEKIDSQEDPDNSDQNQAEKLQDFANYVPVDKGHENRFVSGLRRSAQGYAFKNPFKCHRLLFGSPDQPE